MIKDLWYSCRIFIWASFLHQEMSSCNRVINWTLILHPQILYIPKWVTISHDLVIFKGKHVKTCQNITYCRNRPSTLCADAVFASDTNDRLGLGDMDLTGLEHPDSNMVWSDILAKQILLKLKWSVGIFHRNKPWGSAWIPRNLYFCEKH